MTNFKLQFNNINQKLGFYPNMQVLIHSSEESLNNALYGTAPITVRPKFSTTATFSKTNLNSISTEGDPCADEETLTGADLAIRKVIH